jgi:hypothetical protein
MEILIHSLSSFDFYKGGISLKTMSSVVRELVTPDGVLRMAVSITIIDKNNHYCISRFESDHGEFLTIKTNPRLVIRLSPKGVPWSMSNQVSIHQNHFEDFKYAITEFYKRIMKGDNYVYDDFNRVIEVVKSKDGILRFSAEGQTIVLEPNILIDKQIPLPGIQLTLNEPHITMTISISEFESFLVEIKDMSLYDRGMMILNSYLSFTEMAPEAIMKQLEGKESYRYNYETRDSVRNTEAVSGPIMPKQRISIFDVGGKGGKDDDTDK